MFFSPGNAEILFKARPEVKITAGLSHLVCVTENLHLTGFEKIVDEAIEKTAYIQAGIGTAPYRWQMPGTNTLVAYQWDINVYMKNLLKERYVSNKGAKAKLTV